LENAAGLRPENHENQNGCEDEKLVKRLQYRPKKTPNRRDAGKYQKSVGNSKKTASFAEESLRVGITSAIIAGSGRETSGNFGVPRGTVRDELPSVKTNNDCRGSEIIVRS
jgi:hypothetical protein